MPLIRRIFTLLSGTVMAQFVSFLLLPIISKLYTPAEIGISESLIAVIMLLVVGINGGFEMAMMLPKEEKTVQKITGFAFWISLSICLTLLIFLGLWGKHLSLFFHQNPFESTYLWLPFALFLEGLLQISRYYLMRYNQLRAISVGKVLNILVRNGFSILFAYFLWSFQGLILAFVLGQVANLLPYLFVYVKKEIPSVNISFQSSDYQEVWREYGDFPKYGMASTWLNTAAKQLPYFLFPVYFLAADTLLGHYSFANKILGLPLMLCFIIGDIFYQKASQFAHKADNSLYLFSLKTTASLILVAVLPYTALYFTSDWIFATFLDTKYSLSGTYSQILAPYFFSLFVAIPLTYLIDVCRKLKEYLILNFIFLIIKSSLIIICGKYCSPIETIFYLSWSGTILNFVQIVYGLYIAKQHKKAKT